MTPGFPQDQSDDGVGPILVVDDDVDVREAITEMLCEEGFRAIGAGSAGEAMAAAEACAPSLVLLDLRLGGDDDASQVARSLRTKCGDTLPIVLVTGDVNLTEEAAHAGLSGTLAKPFGVDDLLRCVKQHRMC